MSSRQPAGASLLRVLGLGFSIALAFGGTIGVGILRLPGTVAAALGDATLILPVWIAGGVYATLGAISVSELAAMMPTAGGFYVYARRTFGPGIGFAVGWNDWIMNSVTVAYASLTAADFLEALWPATAGHGKLVGIVVVAVFTLIQLLGIRIGSTVQNVISAVVGTLLLVLAVGCLLVTTPEHGAEAVSTLTAARSLATGWVGLIGAVIVALRSVLVTYDGWYNAIYLAEETVDAARVLPRAMIGCAVLVTALYLLINVAFLHALSLPALAASKLPAADAARLLFPSGAAEFVTAASLLIVLGLINATLLCTPRILFAVARDGYVAGRATEVSAGGTPRFALLATSVVGCLLILSGSLEQLVAVAAVLFVLNYVSAYLAVFVLRLQTPDAPRPFRAWGFPWTTGVVLLGSLVFLGLAVTEDPRSGAFAVVLIGLAAPVYLWSGRKSSG